MQPKPKPKLCQHMVRVKSLKNGWAFGWEGTRDGNLYQLPEDPDTGFYQIIDPLRPPSENCACMRLTPVKLAPEPKPKGTRLPKTGTKTGPKVSQTGGSTLAPRTFAPTYFGTFAPTYFGTFAPTYFGTFAPTYFGTFAPTFYKK